MWFMVLFLPLVAGPLLAADGPDALPEGARLRIGSPRLRHGGLVTGLVFTPDGKGIVSGGGGDIIHWDAATGREIRRFPAGTHFSWPALRYRTDPFALTHDGRVLAVAPDGEWRVILWDLATGKKLHEIPTEWSEHILGLAFSPDGNLIARTTYQGIRLRELDTGKEWKLQGGDQEYWQTLHFAPDGKTLLSGEYFKNGAGQPQVVLWNAARARELRRFEPTRVRPGDYCTRPDLSADGQRLAAGIHNGSGSAREVFVWDRGSGKELHRFSNPAPVHVVGFAPDGRTLAAAGEGGVIVLWNLKTGKKVGRLEYAPSLIGDARDSTGRLAFSPDGTRLAAAGSSDFTIRVWDLATRRLIHPFNVACRGLEAALLSSDGKRVITGGSDGTVQILNAADGKPVLVVHQTEVAPRHLALSADGRQLVAGDRWALRRWEIIGSKLLPCWEKDAAGWPDWIALAPDGREVLVVLCRHKELRLIDLATGKVRWRLPDRNLDWSALFSPDGNHIYLQTGHRLVRVNRISGKMECEVHHGPYAYGNLRAISADEKLLVDSYGQIIGTADLGPQRFLLEDRSIGPAAFRPDGKVLALVAGPGYIQLWDTATWKPLRDLKGHHGDILALMYSADGRALLSGGADGTVLLWDGTR
jgi:WD40 repeat protein